ncbi:ribonuclease H-like domain-containing protein [Mycena crocata]|nr:ribonuclease H-like domain-containing protein [Mycena crocata]
MCSRCFPHITHLACKAILKVITDIDFAENDARDPIATLRSLVRQIWSSSLRRQFFSDILKALKLKDLELLRDVITRWSSTVLMIDRAILLQPAINKLLSSNQFEDLRKYKLGEHEWAALKSFKKILDVPHAFQQKLSAEKTPTLGLAFPAFESMISRWEQMQRENPELADIIQKGLDKLGSYQERVERVPAYVLAMRKFLFPVGYHELTVVL